MFGKTTTPTAPEPAAPVQTEPNPDAQPVPLSVLALDLPEPFTGWRPYLADLGVRIIRDDLGRESIRRGDAAWLLAEYRDQLEAAEEKQREITARNDAEIEARRLANMHPGIPANQVGDLSPAMAMVSAGGPPPWAQSPRTSVLHEALTGESLTFHSFAPAPDNDAA